MMTSDRRHFLKQYIGLTLSLPALFSFKLNFQEQNPPKILFRMGWNSSDNNDLAIVPALYRMAQRSILQADFYIWLDIVDDNLLEMLNKNFTNVKIVTGDIDEAGQPTTEELKNILSETALFFYTSGGEHRVDWSGNGDNGIETRSLEYCLDNGIPYAIIGLGQIPEQGDQLDAFMKITNGAEFVYSTSTATDKALKEKNLKISKLQNSPNLLFAFDLRNDTDSRNVLQQFNLLDRDFLTVDFNTAGLSEEKLEEYAQKVSEVINTWVRKTEKYVLILPNSIKDIEFSINKIYDALEPDIKSKVSIAKEKFMPDLAASIYEKSRIISGMSLFPVCSGVKSGNPVMFLSTTDISASAKTIEDMGLKNSIQDIHSKSGEELSEVLLEINDKYLDGIIESDKAREYAMKKLQFQFDDFNRYVNKKTNQNSNSKDKTKKKKNKQVE